MMLATPLCKRRSGLTGCPLLLSPPPHLQSLWGSTGVCDVLALVLALGNVMNTGNRTRGQADGFDIEILGKLADMRTSDASCSLLQYVVRYYVSHLDQVCGGLTVTGLVGYIMRVSDV